MAAGAQLMKIVERRAGDSICASAKAPSGNSLHASAAGLPQDGCHDHQPGIGWSCGWAKATRRGGRRRGGWRWQRERPLCAGLGGKEAVSMESGAGTRRLGLWDAGPRHSSAAPERSG